MQLVESYEQGDAAADLGQAGLTAGSFEIPARATEAELIEALDRLQLSESMLQQAVSLLIPRVVFLKQAVARLEECRDTDHEGSRKLPAVRKQLAAEEGMLLKSTDRLEQIEQTIGRLRSSINAAADSQSYARGRLSDKTASEFPFCPLADSQLGIRCRFDGRPIVIPELLNPPQ